MLAVASLSKRHAGAARPVFSQLGFAIAAGEIVALVGESGVGKSTLLNCIAGLENADAGEIRVGRERIDILRLDEAERAALRAGAIGFVFQAFHVLPTLSVAQNIAIPLLLTGVPAHEHEARCAACWNASASPASVRAGRPRSPAANCSALPSRGRWCMARR